MNYFPENEIMSITRPSMDSTGEEVFKRKNENMQFVKNDVYVSNNTTKEKEIRYNTVRIVI